LKLIIHDLTDEEFSSLNIAITNKDTKIIAASDKFAYCRGCFNCWLKTPGSCFINDTIKNSGTLLGTSNETVIISKNYYGGYSEPVKRVIDRCISATLPFFTWRDGKIRHMRRYKKNKLCLTVILYGDFLELEKETAEDLVERNRSNMGFKEKKLIMVNKIEDIGGLIQ
jgi:multimeric flavodoxin WrbA